MDNLNKVLSDLKEKQTNKEEFNETEKKNYWELVQSFSDSVTSKLWELKEWDITPELKSQIETKLSNLWTWLETLTLEQTITKIEEIKEILDMNIDIVWNTAVKNIEQLVSWSAFAWELTELSEKVIQDENIKDEPKQNTNVTTLFDPATQNISESWKPDLANNDYVKIEAWSKTKQIAWKIREWTKKVWSKIKDIIRSPAWIAIWAWIWAISIFSKKFRRWVGKVLWAPFSAVWSAVGFVTDNIIYTFKKIWAKLRWKDMVSRKEYMKRWKAYDEVRYEDNPNNQSYQAEDKDWDWNPDLQAPVTPDVPVTPTNTATTWTWATDWEWWTWTWWTAWTWATA